MPSSKVYEAASVGDLSVVRSLIKSIADRNESNHLAMHFAAFNGRINIIGYLASIGCNVNEENNQNEVNNREMPLLLKTPLLCASSRGHYEAVIKLIELGANLSMADEHGSTALHFAAFNNHEDILKYLVFKGALINQQDLQGNTPLHKAVMSGRTDAVKALVTLGADLMIINNDGVTPKQLAIQQGQDNLVKMASANIDGQLRGIYEFLMHDQYSFDVMYSIISYLPLMKTKSRTDPDKLMLNRFKAICDQNPHKTDEQSDTENDAEMVEQLGRLSLSGS